MSIFFISVHRGGYPIYFGMNNIVRNIFYIIKIEDIIMSNFDPSTLNKEVYDAFLLGPIAWILVVQKAIAAGERRADKLADIVFYLHHPERSGKKIGGGEAEAIEEWMTWRELIRPLVKYGASDEIPDGDGPLDGYVCSHFGGQAAERLKVAEERGCLPERGRTRSRLKESDILFISGHHYAGYDRPMDFDAIDLRKFRSVAARVRLIMVSSCKGLKNNSLRNFRRKFPNAYIFGWLFSSPLNQGGLMRNFIGERSGYVEITTSAGMERLVGQWKTFIETLPKGKGAVRSSGLGYATPNGKMEWWDGTKWHTRHP